MMKVSFCDITKQCKALISDVSEEIQKIYEEFNFLYFPYLEKSDFQSSDFNSNIIETALFEFLKKFKFITYHSLEQEREKEKFSIPIEHINDLHIKSDSSYASIDAVICVEQNCILIKNMEESLFNNVISRLNEINISIIKYSLNFYEMNPSKHQEEVNSFYNHYVNQISQSNFVQSTISSIIGYLIRRYFYPNYYFKNQSFFNVFQSNNCNDSNAFKKKITDILNIDDKNEFKYNLRKLKDVRDNLEFDSNFIHKNDFNDNDFIILRWIYTGQRATFHLIFHKNTHCIFVLKLLNEPYEPKKKIKKIGSQIDKKDKIDQLDDGMDETDYDNDETDYDIGEDNKNMARHEYNFCKNMYSDNWFTPFYGFLKTNEVITGFVYKFMSNGNLDKFLKKKKDRFDEAFSLTTMIRIFSGIRFLKEKSMIHRDLKPQNILLDNNFNAYISDFETIRYLKKDDNLKNNRDNKFSNASHDEKSYTNDLGSQLYMAPEQLVGSSFYYAVDIYSFGLLIYYLFEKKDLFINPDTKNILPIMNVSDNIQYIYQNCAEKLPEKRLTLDQIESYIIKEIKDICPAKLNNKFNVNQMTDIIYTFITTIPDMQEKRLILDNIFCYKLESTKSENEKSDLYLKLGICFEDGNGVRKNYLKAKYYYELSMKENNYYAMTYLGKLYYYGNGVIRNYYIAKNLFEKAFDHSSYAILYLANIYYYGYCGGKDTAKALQYYELSGKKKNTLAYYVLGNIYENDMNQNYTKAREYYELSAQLDNSEALLKLGHFYFLGLGVKRDIKKSSQYYSLAIKNYNVDAFNILANLFIIPSGNQNYDFDKKINYLQKRHPKAGTFVNKGYFHINALGINALGTSKSNVQIIMLNYNLLIYREYSPLSNKDNSNIILVLGDYYYFGLNVKQDFSKAKDFYELAAYFKNPYGYLHLGDLYENGLGVDVNYGKARRYYEKAEKLDNSDAYLCLGKLYYYGLGVQKDYIKAKEYFEKSAKLKNSDAYLFLGNLYYHGYGVNKNYEEAIKNYNESNKFLNADTLLSLGNLYLYGHEMIKDKVKAKKLFEQSADEGNPNAFISLGNYYEIEQNYLEAKSCYEKLIFEDSLDYNENTDERNYDPPCFSGGRKDYSSSITDKITSEASFKLGNLYENGLGVEKNIERALHYYNFSVKYKNSNAMLRLGQLYIEGNVVIKDIKKALYLIELSSKQGNSSASLYLGNLYKKGKVVEKNYIKAKHFYELSAQNENSDALFYLGKLYYYGNGIEKNYEIAKDYFYKSGQLGNSNAIFYLGNMYYFGYGFEKNYIKALSYYDLSANQGNPKALYYLGIIYSNGDIIEINLNKAIECYQKCIETKDKTITIFNQRDNSFTYLFKRNNYVFQAYNNLGLIYIIHYNNLENASFNIGKSGRNEYPLGQNSLGLLYQYYHKNNDEAKYFFEKASRNNCVLSICNLGFLSEDENDIVKSIEHFIDASNHQDDPLSFRSHIYYDQRFEISKIFILNFINLKLTLYFLKNEDFKEAKKYFIRSFRKIIISENDFSYEFKYQFDLSKSKINFAYLKKFILEFPSFNLQNEFGLILDESKQNENDSPSQEINNPTTEISIDLSKDQKSSKDGINNSLVINSISFNDPGELFDFIISSNEIKEIFSNEILDIINVMKSLLDKPPYVILFGRISIEKTKPNNGIQNEDVNDSFYEGFYE